MADSVYLFSGSPHEDLSDPFVAFMVFGSIAIVVFRAAFLTYVAFRRRRSRKRSEPS